MRRARREARGRRGASSSRSAQPRPSQTPRTMDEDGRRRSRLRLRPDEWEAEALLRLSALWTRFGWDATRARSPRASSSIWRALSARTSRSGSRSRRDPGGRFRRRRPHGHRERADAEVRPARVRGARMSVRHERRALRGPPRSLPRRESRRERSSPRQTRSSQVERPRALGAHRERRSQTARTAYERARDEVVAQQLASMPIARLRETTHGGVRFGAIEKAGYTNRRCRPADDAAALDADPGRRPAQCRAGHRRSAAARARDEGRSLAAVRASTARPKEQTQLLEALGDSRPRERGRAGAR